jgi:deoxyribonucleoside regulator
MSRQRVNRLVKRLTAEGVVTIHINDYDYNIELENSLEERYGLKQAIVSSTMDAEDVVERIGKAGAKYLDEAVGDGSIIGVSWGTALHSVARHLGACAKKNVSVVQLTGGMTHANISVQIDEIYRQSGEITRIFASKLSAAPYYMNCPVVVENEKIKASLLSEPSIKNSFEMVRKCDIGIIGIGGASEHLTPFRHGHLPLTELEALKKQGAVGNLCFRYYDINGEAVITPLNARIIGPEFNDLTDIPLLVGVAGGSDKFEAILGALRGKYLDVLVTDYETASNVLKES